MSRIAAVDPAPLRRAILRLLVVVAVLLLLAGVPHVAGSLRRADLDAAGLARRAQVLQDAIDYYRVLHAGRLPEAADWDGLLAELGARTDLSGKPGGTLGPCLSAAWAAPGVLGPGSGRVVDALPSAPDGGTDWIYCRTTGELRCNRADR